MHRKPTALCRLFCALLTAALVTAPVSAARYPDKVHLPVDYADMVFTGYDDTSLLAALEDLESGDRSGALRRENR